MNNQRALYVRAGTTWNVVFKKRVKGTCVPVSLAGFSARGQIRNGSSVILALDGSQLTVDPPVDGVEPGSVSMTVSSTETALLNTGDLRAELTIAIELYDTSSPVVVEPLVDTELIVLPAALV